MFIMVTKENKIGRLGSRHGERGYAHTFVLENPKGKDHWKT
jgi:hypothetical protein